MPFNLAQFILILALVISLAAAFINYRKTDRVDVVLLVLVLVIAVLLFGVF